jgi:hypothetical protein
LAKSVHREICRKKLSELVYLGRRRLVVIQPKLFT